MEVRSLFGLNSVVRKKRGTDGRIDGRTDGPMDRSYYRITRLEMASMIYAFYIGAEKENYSFVIQKEGNNIVLINNSATL